MSAPSWKCSLCGLINKGTHQICHSCFTNVGDFDYTVSGPALHAANRTPIVNGSMKARDIEYTLLEAPPFNDIHQTPMYCKTTDQIYFCHVEFDTPYTHYLKFTLSAYNLRSNDYNQISTHSQAVPDLGVEITVCLQSEKQQLFVFSNTCLLAIYDIDHRQWQSVAPNKVASHRYDIRETGTQYIGEPVNQFLHFIIDDSQVQWMKFKPDASVSKATVHIRTADLPENIENFQWIHIPKLHMVLLFGGTVRTNGSLDGSDWSDSHDGGAALWSTDGENKQFFWLNTNKMCNDRERWKVHKSLQSSQHIFSKEIVQCLLAFDYMLMVFVLDRKRETIDVCCYDFLCLHQWLEPIKIKLVIRYHPSAVPSVPKHFFLSDDGEIYALMQTKLRHILRGLSQYWLIKFGVRQLIPVQLIKPYRQYLSLRVYGYVRSMQLMVPEDVMRIIVVYFLPL